MGKGKTCLKPSEAAQAHAIANAVRGLSAFKQMTSKPTLSEVTFCWRDKETEILCKARPDLITEDFLTVADPKSAMDPTHRAFQSAAYRYHYFVSAAFTLIGIHAVIGIMPRRYVFFVVQSSSPHLVAAYEATADELRLGLAFVRRNLRRLRECMDSGRWPGLPETVQPLGLPPWVNEDVGIEADDFSNLDPAFGLPPWVDLDGRAEDGFSTLGNGNWWE